MNKIYKKRAIENFIKKQSSFTYRVEFERRIYEFPEELQVEIFSKESESESGQETAQVIEVALPTRRDIIQSILLKSNDRSI